MLLPTGTLLVMLAPVLVAFKRIRTSALFGGVGVWLLRALHLIGTAGSSHRNQ